MKAEKKPEQKKQWIAVIRIKGKPGLKVDVRKTFEVLRLYKKYHCVVIPNTAEYVGMLTKIKDASTWGEIDQETLKVLLQKRGKLAQKKALTEDYLKDKVNVGFDDLVKEVFAFKKTLGGVPGLKLFFKLSPPRHGFEQKGIKLPYSLGGVLGYRKDKVNDLLKRMV